MQYLPSYEEISEAKALGKTFLIDLIYFHILLSVKSGHLKKEVIESLAKRLIKKQKKGTKYKYITPHLPEITTAASLAHHGRLGSVHSLELIDVDLASVPAEHLASLVSCVTDRVKISDVRNCPTLSILDSVRSKWLGIFQHSLGIEVSLALVRAMESRLERVYLGSGVSLNIEALTQYSGQGKCWEVIYFDDTKDTYREDVRSWSQRINWDVSDESWSYVQIKTSLVATRREESTTTLTMNQKLTAFSTAKFRIYCIC